MQMYTYLILQIYNILRKSLFLQLSGEVIEFNEGLEDTPEDVNTDPYEAGWMIKLKISDASEIDSLLSDADYKALVGA